jgi:hypothetical protein
MKHVALVARRYWATCVGHAVGLDQGFTVWQNMAIWVVLQCSVLRSMGEAVEWRGAHVLRSQMVVMLGLLVLMVVVLLVVIDHVGCRDMAEGGRVLLETGRHHGCEWWETQDRGRLYTTRTLSLDNSFPRLNGVGSSCRRHHCCW